MYQARSGWLGLWVVLIAVVGQMGLSGNAQVINSGPGTFSTASVTLQASIPPMIHTSDWKQPVSPTSTLAFPPGNLQVVYHYTVSDGTHTYTGALISGQQTVSLQDEFAQALRHDLKSAGEKPSKAWAGTLEISTLFY